MRIDEHDIEIGRYIISILQKRLEIVASWGLNPKTLKAIKSGVEFHVQGFIHTGMVQVTLNEGEDLFEVVLISEAGEIIEKHTSIYLDNLISVIDDAVEKVDNYEQRISQEYPYLQDIDNPEKIRHTKIIIL